MRFESRYGPPWFWIAVLLSVAVFVLNVLFSELAPDNAWGLGYGAAATVLLVGVFLYFARRRTMRRDFGDTRYWLQFHVYGGFLFMLFLLMHSGLALPVGGFNRILWILSVWVTVSGAFGLLLQKWIPTLLASGLSIEAVYERIPELVDEIRARAESLTESAAEPLRDFYAQILAPTLSSPNVRLIYYLDVTGGINARLRQCERLKRMLGEEDQKRLESLTALYKTKLELDAHYTLQRALRWWLFSHVPLSFCLLVAVAIHLWLVLHY